MESIASKNNSGKNLKQSFYLISKNQNNEDLYNDLSLVLNREVPVMALINPYESLPSRSIDTLKDLQKEKDLKIVLLDTKNLSKTPFILKDYHKDLNISALCHIDETSMVYLGAKEIFFDLTYIGNDPLDSLDLIEKVKNSQENIGIISNSEDFNISSFLLASEEIQGSPLEVLDYELQVEEALLIEKSFYYIGDIAIIFFTIAILVLSATILIFRKWSRENFLD